MRTTYRTIMAYGLLTYRPRLVLPLTNRHRQLRLTWCQKRAHWNQEWDNDGRRRVRRRREERRQLQFCVERETALTRGVMV
nr:unnamed protein product [Callosobruchus chinensis]